MRLARTERWVVLLGLLALLLACKKLNKKSVEESSAAAGDKIGVAECDEYLTKYEKCLKDKVPAMARGSLEQGMEQMRDAWKQAAQNEAAKAGLATGCKQALESAKATMGSYGCQW
jgi:hypothetical protein